MVLETSMWPVFEPGTVRPPVAILQEQADSLSLVTNSVLRGKVATTASGNDLFLSFRIVAPVLDYYEYELFCVHHDLNFYPVVVDSALVDERREPIAFSGVKFPLKLDSEEQFVGWLERQLRDGSTKKIIEALLTQSSALKKS